VLSAIADFQLASTATYWRESEMPLQDFPNIVRWIDGLMRIPAGPIPGPLRRERSASQISRQIREQAPRRGLHEPGTEADVPEIQIGEILHLHPKGRRLAEQRETIAAA
jgi:hypothetical protein